ncbi:MAG: DUF2796 domain-containing protein [Rhodocyclales bacterium]|nr:DUF2796 domain-containing protein [Rhodocyclales bacterium]
MRPTHLLALLAILSLPAHAQHAHGEGKLDVVIDKDSIAINLELPLDAAVGFERAPKNDREKAALAAAEKALGDAALFVPTPAANCKALPPKVVMPAFGAKAGADDHGDIDASYAFRCANPAALKGVETGIFKQFKRLYRLEAQRAGPTGQGAARLTPKSPAITW